MLVKRNPPVVDLSTLKRGDVFYRQAHGPDDLWLLVDWDGPREGDTGYAFGLVTNKPEDFGGSCRVVKVDAEIVVRS